MNWIRRFGSIIFSLVLISFFIGGCVTKGRFRDQVNENQSLADQLREEQQQRRHLEDDFAALRERHAKLRSRLVDEMKSGEEKTQALEDQLSALKQAFEFAKDLGGKTERELKRELIRVRGSYESSLQKARERISELGEQLKRRNEAFLNIQERMDVQNEALTSLRSALDERDQDISLLKNRLSDRDQEVTQLTEQLRLRDEVVARLEQEQSESIESHKTRVESLQQRIRNLSQEVVRLSDALKLSEGDAAKRARELREASKAHDALTASLRKEIEDGSIKITRLKNRLTVEIVDKIIFSSGSDQITSEGRDVLKKVSEVLSQVTENDIRIEGHTDNVPIGSRLIDRFASNWELSTARATQVVRFLSTQAVPPENMLAAGFSKYRPIVSNETDEGKQRNRRIEIVLFPRDVVKIIESVD